MFLFVLKFYQNLGSFSILIIIYLIYTKRKRTIYYYSGRFVYVPKKNEIKKLLSCLKSRIGNYTLIFDAYSVFTAKNANIHPALKKTGAKIHWGINDPEELTKWGSGIQLIDEKHLTDSEEINNLKLITKIMFKIANIFSVAKKAHRILIYRIRS